MKKSIEQKQQEFNHAMNLYQNNSLYKNINMAVSIINICLQIVLLIMAFQTTISIKAHIAAIIISFIFADLINGFVHLVMDNNANYTSFAGPFVASFHLHHRTPAYKKRNIFIVYFNEAGSKIWLAVYFITLFIWVLLFAINPFLFYTMVYFGIFSCIAEISHYCCHIPDPPVPKFIIKAKIFMSKRYHAKHHLKDNYRYAFLNGMTNSLLDIIAKLFFKGYKNHTDLHYAAYKGQDTENR